MGKTTINLTSITYAMKAQRLLEQVGIFTTIGRTRKNKEGLGCGYSLFIKSSDLNRTLDILSNYNIRVVSVEPFGGSRL